MKRIKRLFSFLLVLVMLLGLFPAALAEEPVGSLPDEPEQSVEDGALDVPQTAPAQGEGSLTPAFLLQPASGSVPEGEDYLVTWALEPIPDRLELAKEDPVGADALGGPAEEDEEPALIPVRELDPASTELALTAPEEETVFYLRAFYGEEELLSEPFTVTLEPAGVDVPGDPEPEEPVEETPVDPVPAEEPELVPAEEELDPDSLLPIGEPVKVSGTVNASSLAESSDLILEGTTTLNMDVERTLRSIRGPYDLTITGSSKLLIHTTLTNGIDVSSLTAYTSMDIFTADIGIKADGPVLVRNAALLKIWSETAVQSTDSIDIEANVIDIDSENTALSIGLGGTNKTLRVSAGDLTINTGGNGIYSYVTPVTVLVSGTGSIESTYKNSDDAGFCIKAGGTVTLGGGGVLTMKSWNTCVKASDAVSSSNLSLDLYSSRGSCIDAASFAMTPAALLKMRSYYSAVKAWRFIDVAAVTVDVDSQAHAFCLDNISSAQMLRLVAVNLTIEADLNGLYAQSAPITLTLSGEGTLTTYYNGADDKYGYGISGKTVTLGGGGTLSVRSTETCINALGAVSASDLSLDLYSNRSFGIDGYTVAISNTPSLEISSGGSAVYAWSAIDVAAGTMDIFTDKTAFIVSDTDQAGSIRVSGADLSIEARYNVITSHGADVTVNVSGTGTMTSLCDFSSTEQGYGILAGGDVTLGGGGTLTISSKNDCINTGGSVTGSNLSLDLTSTSNDGIDAYKSVTLTNIPTLKITSQSDAIVAFDQIVVTAGTLTVDAGWNGLVIFGSDEDDSITVTAGTLSIEADANAIRTTGGAVSLTVSGTGLLKSSYSGTDTEIGYGIKAAGNVNLGGAGTLTVSSKRDCINTGGSVTGSNLSLDLTSTSNDGIDAYKSVTLTNIPTLKITSGSDAIVAFDQIVVTAGTLTVDAGWNGLVIFGSDEDDSITVTAGTLSIEAKANAIRTTGGAVSLTVSGTGLLKSSYSGTDTEIGYGIKAAGNVNLGGAGTLTVSSKRDCIYTAGSVTGSNLSLDLTSTSNDGIDAYKSVTLTNIPTLKITSGSDAIVAFDQIVVSAGTLTVDAGWNGLVIFGSDEDDSITVTAGTLSIEAKANAIRTTGGAVSLTVSGTGLLKSSYSGTDTDYGYGIRAAGDITLGGGGTLTLTGKWQGARSLSGGLILANGTTYYAESTGEHDALYAYGGITLDSSLVICVPKGGALGDSGRTIVNTYGTCASYVVIGQPLTGSLIMENAGGDCRVGDQIKVICSGVPRDASYVWQTSEDGENWTDMTETAQAMTDSQNVTSVKRIARLAESDQYFRLRAFRSGLVGELFSEAIHVKRAYKVRYYPNGGSGTMDDVGAWLHAGDSYTLLESHFTPPERKGFSAWRVNGVEYQPGDVITIAGETSIYAVWERSEWQIQFSSGSGSGASGTMSPLTVPCGQSFTVPACTFTPPSGKVFSRWGVTGGKYYRPGDVITPSSDMLLVAQWRSNQTVVGFDPNGGSGSMNPVNLTPAQAAAYTVPECTYNPPEDSVFEKWQIVTPGSSETVYAQPGDTVALSGFNVTLKAIWALKPSFEVSFSANGHGTAPLPQSVMQDHYAEDPGALTAEGYTFLGWYTDAAGTNRFDFAHTAITGNITLYAKWIDKVMSIEIDGFRFPEAGLTSVRPQLITTGGPYACTRIKWTSQAGSSGWVSYVPITFMASTEYTAVITLETLRDARFDTSVVLESVTINGESVGVDMTQSGFVSETKYELVTLPVTTDDLIPIDEAHFPDDAFRTVLAGNYDLNRDGYFSRSEISVITSLSLTGKGIADLTGVGILSELKSLNITNNALTTLDLSTNGMLEEVYCSNNPGLTELLLPKNSWLKWLQCYSCSLTGLDVRGCTYLALAAAQTPTYSANGQTKTYTYYISGAKTAEMIVDASDTLYDSYENYARVRFDPGLGSGSMPYVMVYKGEYYTLPANGFTAPEDMYFNGWSLNGTDTVYSAGETMERLFEAGENEIVFVAQWKSKKVLSITVPDATRTQSPSGFPVGYTWNYDSITLTPGKWLDSYDVDTHTAGSIATKLLANTTYYGTITFPRGVSAQDIIREINGGTLVLKNATLVDLVSSGSGSSVRTTMVFSLKPRTCTVSFMSGGGSGTMVKKTNIYPGSTYTLPNCGFTPPADMVFGYWSLAWAGSSVHDDVLGLPGITVTVDEDLTLIARWNVSAGAIPITPDYFPDDDFRDYVSMNFDTNHGGYLIRSEIAAATSIEMDSFEDLTSVQGIQYLTELTDLMLTCDPGLSEIDISANTKLCYLELGDDGLSSLDLTGLTQLTELYVNGNDLTFLDVSECQDLTDLAVSNNPLTGLVLREHPELKNLSCYAVSGNFKILDIRDCPYLLDAYQNGERTTLSYCVKYAGSQGGALYVDDAIEILTPDCVSVDVTHFPDPLFLDLVGRLFDTNHTQWLTPAEIAAARELVIEDTEIASLEGIEYLTALERLTYQDGTLETLDLTRNTKLQYLDLNGQEDLEILELGELSELRSLYLESAAYFRFLDLSGCSALEEVHCQGSCLETLTLGQQAHLRILDAFWLDALEGLDISGCPILMDLLENTSPSVENWVITFTDGENRLRIDQSVDINGYAHPDILAGPANVTAAIEDTAVFTVEAEGARLRLQWQYSADGGETWTELPGATGATLEITVTPEMDGRLFRCAAAGVYGITAYSRSATLSINGGLCGETAYWKLQDGVLTVYGAGDMYDYTANNEKAPWYDLRTSITSVLIRDGVTSIGKYAFDSCSKISSVSIGGEVTRIGIGAFRYCTSLTAAAVPDSVTEIGFDAFMHCEKMETVTIGSGAASIGGNAISGSAFEFCYSLRSITVSPANTAYCSEDGVLFKLTDGVKTELNCYPAAREGESYEIPDTVTSLFRYAFYKSKDLNSVTVPASVTEIGMYCFGYANDLTEITFLGSAPTTIKSDAFYNVTATVWYPDDGSWTEENRQDYRGHLTWIPWRGQCGDDVYWAMEDGALRLTGTGAMWNYTNDAPAPWKDSLERITALYVEEGVTKLGNYAFAGCAALSSANLPEGLTVIGKNAFYNCTLLWEIAIPSTVTSIYDSAFMNCESLTELILPEGLTSINSYVFKNCTSLRSVSIPSTVTRIMGSTFELCSSLTDVTIPAGVTVIGSDTFGRCSALSTITFEGSAPQINATAFRDVTATAWYPAGDESWTEDMFQDYGGDITWMSYAAYLTVTLDPGDGTVEPATIQVRIGQPVGELPTPVLEAYGFDGWFTAAGDAVTAETVFTEDVTLVAHWHRCGDINGDGKVNNKDVTRLQRYVKYHDVTVVEGALDVNGDGKVNNKDVTRLQRYVKYHDVEIH